MLPGRSSSLFTHNTWHAPTRRRPATLDTRAAAMRGTGPAQQPYATPPPASPAAHPAAAAAAAAGGDAAPQAAPQPKRLRVGVPPQPATASHAATADPPTPSLPAVAPLNALSEAALLASQADMPAAAGQQPLPGGAGSPLPAPLALSLQALLARPSPHAASVPAAPSTQQRARGVHGRPGAAAGPRSEVPSAPDPNAHERQPAASTRRPAARQPRTPAAASGAAAAPSPAITLTLAPINTATPPQALLESRGSGGSSGSTRRQQQRPERAPQPHSRPRGSRAGGRGGSGHSSALKQLTPEQKVERILEHHGQSFCEELQVGGWVGEPVVWERVGGDVGGRERVSGWEWVGGTRWVGKGRWVGMGWLGKMWVGMGGWKLAGEGVQMGGGWKWVCWWAGMYRRAIFSFICSAHSCSKASPALSSPPLTDPSCRSRCSRTVHRRGCGSGSSHPSSSRHASNPRRVGCRSWGLGQACG